jgi:hypothetical protein
LIVLSRIKLKELMKTIVVALIALGLCAQARSTSLSTTDGTTFNNVTSQRVDPDGLYIEYTLPGGGLGMSKVKFARLSSDQQKQFGFDAAKARDYEAQAAKAADDYRQEWARMEQAALAQRQAQQDRAVQEEKADNDRIIALAQLKAAEADLARATEGGGNYGWGGGDGLFAIPQVGRHVPPARTQYAPVVTPIPLQSRSVVRSH